MSFGFSISDIVNLVQLTTSTYNGWKNACGEYTGITADLVMLETLLKRMETEASSPTSLFTHNLQDLRGWKSLSKICRTTVLELQAVLDKYQSLGTNRRKNWDRIRLGNNNLDGLHQQLIKRITSLSAFASVMGISSQVRVEHEILPELLQRMDLIAEQVRKGTASVSTYTTYPDDDKSVWKDFRRDMLHAGVRSSDLRQYSSALRTYLVRLQREGLLEEEIPHLESSSHINSEPNECVSSGPEVSDTSPHSKKQGKYIRAADAEGSVFREADKDDMLQFDNDFDSDSRNQYTQQEESSEKLTMNDKLKELKDEAEAEVEMYVNDQQPNVETTELEKEEQYVTLQECAAKELKSVESHLIDEPTEEAHAEFQVDDFFEGYSPIRPSTPVQVPPPVFPNWRTLKVVERPPNPAFVKQREYVKQNGDTVQVSSLWDEIKLLVFMDNIFRRQ